MAEAQGGPLEMGHLHQCQVRQQAWRYGHSLPQVPIGVSKLEWQTLACQWGDWLRRLA